MKNGSIDIIDLHHPVGCGEEIHQEYIGSHPEKDMLQCPVPCQFQKKPSNIGDDHPAQDEYIYPVNLTIRHLYIKSV
jgi:hypothetical protein